MMRRNGSVGKIIAVVVIFFGAVYTIYLYNDLSGQLKNTERTAERYRREQESVSAQLQDLTASKNELKQRCDNEKQEMTSRLNSLNQQHKMLKSQHDDMESEFSRLQSEHEREADEHRRLDEERTLEYNQFKQEKILEISNLKDAVANLEREKQQLNEEINKLKTQLQNSLFQLQQDRVLIHEYRGQLAQAQNMVQQANQQQQIQQQNMLQQQPAQHQQQQLNLPAMGLHQEQNFPGDPQLGLVHQQGLSGGMQQQRGFFQHKNPNPIANQQQQGNFHQQQPGGEQAQQKVGEGMNMNIAEEILQSLKDKHKPVDADQVEEQQKQHQILPPLDHDKVAKDGKKDESDVHKQEGLGAGDREDGHDNRLQNQGPVGLQVQEPKLKPDPDHDAERKNLLFRPKIPEPIDNQIQPHQPVDDTIKQEQLDMPVKPMQIHDHQVNNLDQADREDNLEHDDEEEDDENYDDTYDKEHNENEKEDDAY